MRTNIWQPDPEASFARRLGLKPTDPGSGGGGDDTATGGETGCPEIWELDNGDVAVIGRDLTDNYASRLPDGTSVGPNERLVVIPRGMARATVLYREIRDRWGLANALVNLAVVETADGDDDGARTHATEAATVLTEFEDPRAARVLDRIAGLRA